MQINKNSWHYKFRKSLYEHSFMKTFPPYENKAYDLDTNNGCKYLRDVFLWPWLWILLVILFGTSAAFLILSPFVSIFAFVFGNFAAFADGIVGFLMIVLTGVMGIFLTILTFAHAIGTVEESEIVQGAIEFITEKTCPVVSYKD